MLKQSHLESLYESKIKALPAALRADTDTSSAASQIFRSLIDRIVVYPRPERGLSTIEAYGDATALVADRAGLSVTMTKMVAEERYHRKPTMNEPVFRIRLGPSSKRGCS